MSKRLIFSATWAVLAVFASLVHAQVGLDSGLWQWTAEAEHHQAIVQVTAGEGIGTGVVIRIDEDKPVKDGFEGYVLTAWHVIKENLDDDEIGVVYRNGRKAKKCKVVTYDRDRDVAIIWVWVPDGVPAAKIASQPIRHGDSLEFCGLGGGSDIACNIRHFSGVASSPSSLDRIFADVPLLPGDSGGPVFNENREVVGIISGGWFWYDGGVTTNAGSNIKTTWPARASNVEPIRELVAEVDSQTAGDVVR